MAEDSKFRYRYEVKIIGEVKLWQYASAENPDTSKYNYIYTDLVSPNDTLL